MIKKRLTAFLFTFVSLIYLEVLIRLFTFGSFDARFFFTVAFTLPAAGFIFLFTLFKNSSLFKIIYNALIGVATLICLIQTVYFNIFGNLCSAALVSQGGDAVTNFAGQTLAAILDSIFPLILLLLPLAASVTLTATGRLTFEKARPSLSVTAAAAVILAHGLAVASLTVGGTGSFSPLGTYTSLSAPMDGAAQSFGLFSALRRDVENLILRSFGFSDTNDVVITEPADSDTVFSEEEYNVLSIDMDDFIDEYSGISKSIDQISSFIASRTPTEKNEYTGMFEGYNLITICAESFSPYAISEELTPTLYKMSTEGFIFENFYGSFSSLTTNGEYTFHTGMFPDVATTASFYAAKDNALPFTLGNMFSASGVDTYAYHNYLGTYFNRELTHPNLGYDVFRTPDRGLDIDIDWPSSDLDMIKASVDEYIGKNKQFHTYYMTFSGHYKYDLNNPMAIKNYDAVKDLSYPTAVKAYLACNLELEYALEYLVEALEEAGIAHKTVIALANDHFPYGLTMDQYSTLAGERIDNDFEKYRNSFILWSPSMEEPVRVEKLCSTIDILPTLLNLFGFEYDSRFIMGSDALSDGDGIAILANSSFITEDFRFNAEDNVTESLNGEDVPEAEVIRMQNRVRNIMNISKLILTTDYYSYYVDYLSED
ncbi:MAG: sulfatase-like hydrolase/transferase [Clostridia bacterium]|nr:sulfatase-like hydrolase/transferase [Clostridia bacterium]